MITIHADEYDIVVDNTYWRLFKTANLDTPVFEYTRANDATYYRAEFGKQVGLPGEGIETQFIRAVLVGYHQRLMRWVLGLHLSESPEAKPIFRELVRWQEGDSNISMQDAQTAARTLATILQRPLKVFGARKFPVPTADVSRSGMTGPLQPHNRERIDQDEVDRRTIGVTLPIRAERFILEEHERGLVLRVTDQGGLGDEETPLYSLCEINSQRQEVRMVPPTGLLGGFVETTVHTVPFAGVFNVEVRHMTREEVYHDLDSPEDHSGGDQTRVRHVWGIYLTLPSESLLVAQSQMSRSGRLVNAIKSRGDTKFDTLSDEGLQFFAEHLEEEERMEEHQQIIDQAAAFIASTIGCHIVETEVEVKLEP